MSNGSNQSVVGNSRSDKRVDVVPTLGWFGEASLGFYVADFRHSFRKNVIRHVYVCHLFEPAQQGANRLTIKKDREASGCRCKGLMTLKEMPHEITGCAYLGSKNEAADG